MNDTVRKIERERDKGEMSSNKCSSGGQVRSRGCSVDQHQQRPSCGAAVDDTVKKKKGAEGGDQRKEEQKQVKRISRRMSWLT